VQVLCTTPNTELKTTVHKVSTGILASLKFKSNKYCKTSVLIHETVTFCKLLANSFITVNNDIFNKHHRQYKDVTFHQCQVAEVKRLKIQ
jgi:hypothetical protein